MNILITGGSGLLGVEVINQLKHNHLITSLVRTKPTHKLDKVRYIECDLASDFDVTQFPKNIDVIIHLAQSPYYKEFPNKADHVFKVNCHSTLKLLEYAKSNGIKHFVFSSTGSVYEPYSGQIQEQDNIDPNSFYANSKIISERLIHSFEPYFKTSILRLFFLYGKHGSNKQTIINRLACRIINGDEVTIEGDNGALVITPTLTNDIAQCIKTIVEKEIGGILNLANPEQCSFKHIIDTLVKELNPLTKIKRLPQKEITSIIPNLEKMQKLLPNIHWTPFQDGVKLLNPNSARRQCE